MIDALKIAFQWTSKSTAKS